MRLAREGGADRVDHKRSKRDVEWARAHTTELEDVYRANTRVDPETGASDWPWPEFRHLRLDNSHSTPADTAELIVTELGLPRLT